MMTRTCVVLGGNLTAAMSVMKGKKKGQLLSAFWGSLAPSYLERWYGRPRRRRSCRIEQAVVVGAGTDLAWGRRGGKCYL